MRNLLVATLFVFSSNALAAQPVTPPADASAQPGMSANMAGMDAPTDTTLLAAQPHHACREDVEKLCKGVKAGDGAIMKCLKEHEALLSPACKAKGDAMKEKFKDQRHAIRDTCRDDFEKNCKGTEGPKKRLECLQAHFAGLSEACKNSLPPAQK